MFFAMSVIGTDMGTMFLESALPSVFFGTPGTYFCTFPISKDSNLLVTTALQEKANH